MPHPKLLKSSLRKTPQIFLFYYNYLFVLEFAFRQDKNGGECVVVRQNSKQQITLDSEI